MKKLHFLLCLSTCFILTLNAQVSPVKSLSLKKEQTQVPADSLGNTWFYYAEFEVVDTLVLTSAVFHLKSIVTGAIVNQQSFVLPTSDGKYQNGAFTSGIIKEHDKFFIALGNVKSLDPLTLVGDFTDSKSLHYNTIKATE